MAGNSGGEGRKEGVCGVTRLLSTSSEIISSPVLRRRNGEIMREALREGGRERVKVAIIAMMKSRGGRKGVIYSLLIWPDRRSESPIHAVSRRHD